MTIHWPRLTMLPHCQKSEAIENGRSRARPKDQPLRSHKFFILCFWVRSQYLRSHQRTFIGKQQNRCNHCTENAVTVRIRFTVVRFTSEGNHNRLDVMTIPPIARNSDFSITWSECVNLSRSHIFDILTSDSLVFLTLILTEPAAGTGV